MYISVEGNQVQVSDPNDDVTVITNFDQFLGYLKFQWAGENIYCSSTLDYPEDETRDPETLALVEQINAYLI